MPLRVSTTLRPFTAALTMALLSVSTAAWTADWSQDYRFEVLDQPVPVGAHTEFTVSLTKVSSGQPVTDATIGSSRLQMTMTHPPHKGPPGGMATQMTGEVKYVDSPSPGQYRLIGDVSMPGTWTLDVTANVPGEPKPIVGTAKFKAGK